MTATTRKLVFTALLLAMASSNAMAEWVKLGSSEADTLYFDPSSIRGSEESAKMWTLSDFKQTQRLESGEQFMSEKAEFEHDCKSEQSRLLYFTAHAKSMADGEVVNFNIVPGEWTPVSPGTKLALLWNVVCRRA